MQRVPADRWAMYGGQDPRDVPAYATPEAARYLRMPLRTLQNWAFGYSLSGNRSAKPLIQVADPAEHRLSFWNVAELHVLDSMRTVHGITVQNLRRLIEHLEYKFKTPHPLINERMFAGGGSVLVEKAGRLINATRDGQIVIQQVVEAHLRRIEVDIEGVASILYPFVRRKPDPNIKASLEQEPRIVSMNPLVRFGRPVIAGTGIPTAEIAIRFRAGDSTGELAEEYGRPQSEIEEAIRCELALDRPAA